MKTSTQTSMLVNGAIGTVGSEIVKQLSEKEIQIYKISKISSSQNYEKPESYNKLFGVDYGGKRRKTMTDHKIGTREVACGPAGVRSAEKALTRRSDELAQRRQSMPWVRIDKEYRFETDEGMASLADLFRGRSQLIIYHFMFGPEYRGTARHARDRGRL